MCHVRSHPHHGLFPDIPGDRLILPVPLTLHFFSFCKNDRTKQELTKWDCIAGDGDCGTTFKRGAEALITDLEAGRLPEGDLRMLLRALSDRWARGMNASIGRVLGVFNCVVEEITALRLRMIKCTTNTR